MKKRFVLCLILCIMMVSVITASAASSASDTFTYAQRYVYVNYWLSIVNGVIPLPDKIWYRATIYGPDISQVDEENGTHVIVHKNSNVYGNVVIHSGNLEVKEDNKSCGYLGNDATMYLTDLDSCLVHTVYVHD